MPKNGYVEEKKIVYEKKNFFWRESIRNGLLSLQLKFEKNSLVTFVRGQEFPKSPYCSKQPPGGVWPTQKTKVFFVYSLTLALRGGAWWVRASVETKKTLVVTLGPALVGHTPPRASYRM